MERNREDKEGLALDRREAMETQREGREVEAVDQAAAAAAGVFVVKGLRDG